jgi:hypothetical protein
MPADTAELTYAAPLARGEALHHHGDDGVRFELGPVSTDIFVTRIVAKALYTTFVASLALRPIPATRWRLLVVGLWALDITVTVLRATRHRLTSRVVGATPDNVFYSGPHTRGELLSIPRSDVESVGVRRSWWRPWVFELVAVRRAPRFLSASTKHYGPVVLLIDLDYSLLASMAAAVRDVPRPAVPTPCPR